MMFILVHTPFTSYGVYFVRAGRSTSRNPKMSRKPHRLERGRWNARFQIRKLVETELLYIVMNHGSRLPNTGTWIEGAGERERES